MPPSPLRSIAYARLAALALALVSAVALSAAVSGTDDEPAGGLPLEELTLVDGQCPLTLPQEHEATRAFEGMMPAVLHPRCFNCHGGVDPFRPADEGGHMGGELPKVTPGACQDCHNDVRNLRNGRFFEWEVPVDPFHFVSKSPRELCNQFKALEATPERFVGHMIDENGGVQFAEAAFRGDRALNAHGRAVYEFETGRTLVPEPPPIAHSELVAHAREWADAVGERGWKIRDCGCRLGGDAWEGTVSTLLTGRAEGLGTITERMEATVRFEIDSSYIDEANPDPAIYWKTTSGVLNWTVTTSGGECRANAGGTAPIRLGGDDNPWGNIRMEVTDQGAIAYAVGIGPWPEAYEPRFVWRCTREPTVRPGFAYGLYQWWKHADDATVEADGKTIKGTFTEAHPLGTIRWIWDFKLVRR